MAGRDLGVAVVAVVGTIAGDGRRCPLDPLEQRTDMGAVFGHLGVAVVAVVGTIAGDGRHCPSIRSSKGPTWEPSLSVSTEATIRPVSASVARCSTLQARRRLVPCFSMSHSLAPQSFSPVLSTSRCTGSLPAFGRGTSSVLARRLRVE
jgi:hypothetical protein